MLNLADLGMLLATVVGAFAGVGAARERGVGWPVVLFVLLGLVVGAAIGIAGKKLSYAALTRTSLRAYSTAFDRCLCGRDRLSDTRHSVLRQMIATPNPYAL